MGLLLALLLPIWVEAIGYGFFFCLFCVMVYIYFSDVLRFVTGPRGPASRANIMLFISTIMFIVATIHLALLTYRLINDYIDVAFPPILQVGRWDNIIITTLYVTQELIGSGAAVYRCWVLWNMDWRVVAFPMLVFLGELAIGYVPTYFFTKSDLATGIVDPRIPGFITSFYVLCIAANVMTTGLIVFRLWTTHRSSHVTKSILVPIMWILVESAMLQLVVEVILLGLFLANSDAQFVFFGLLVPVIGITFTAITVRIKLVSVRNSLEGSLAPSSSTGNGARYPRRIYSSCSRRVEVFTDIMEEEEMFRTSDYYKDTRTELSSENVLRTQV